MSDIKIKNIKPKIQYKSDGQTLTYDFPFTVFKAENIKVYLNDKKQTNGYTVSLNNEYSGSITFETYPSKDTIITIVRYMNIERTSDFQVGGAIRAEELNYELDYQTACTQQIADDLNRSMILPPYIIDDDIDFTMPLPDAGKCIVWSEDGKSIENSKIEVNSLLTEVENKTNIVIEKSNIVEKNTNTVNDLTNTCIDIEKNINPSSFAKSNLANTGYISNCILEAPNGVLELSDDLTQIIVKQGLKLLIPNGKSENGKLENIEYTVSKDIICTPILSEGTTPITYFVMINSNDEVYISTSDIWEGMENYIVIGKYISYASSVQKILSRDIFELKDFIDIGSLTAIKEYENQDGKTLNLDDYITQGVYNFSNLGSIINIPTGSQGTLVVLGSKNTLKQIWYASENEEEIYIRTFNKLENIWTSWIKNLTNSKKDKSILSSYGMPSGKYTDLVLGTSGTTYTAPANGYVLLKKSSTASNQIVELYTGVNVRSISSASNQQICVFAPVQKGFNFSVNYSLAGETTFFRFIYAEGDNV